MAIVSKTNPKGVDNVIDAIQQYLYPSLLGLGWTDYEMFPRANKNSDGTSIIPEISTDPKDYQSVLFSDKYNATSFFLVSDEVTINNEERLIVQDVSIVFQLNLKELYPSVTTHRADEESHAHLTQLFTSNDDLFVDVGGYVTTVDRVYSDLSIRDFSRGNLQLDDMSKFHVVRYDFTVTYGLDDCQVNFSPACDPASISINGDSFQIVPSGGALDITIEDTLGNNPIVSIVGDVVTVAAGGGTIYNSSGHIKRDGTTQLTNDAGDLNPGDGAGFFTLSNNNPKGNTNRFTDELGTQVYANNWVIDWRSRNQLTGLTTGYLRIVQPASRLDTALLSEPFTNGIYTDWRIWDGPQMYALFNYGTVNDWFNYAPFNIDIATYPNLWTKSRIGASRYERTISSGISNSFFNSVYPYVLTRQFTDAELNI